MKLYNKWNSTTIVFASILTLRAVFTHNSKHVPYTHNAYTDSTYILLFWHFCRTYSTSS